MENCDEPGGDFDAATEGSPGRADPALDHVEPLRASARGGSQSARGGCANGGIHPRVFHSAAELEMATQACLEHRNADRKPFRLHAPKLPMESVRTGIWPRYSDISAWVETPCNIYGPRDEGQRGVIE
jgi:hypothetical protein